jgi:anti-sigma regulatory factor (Ser/Thr protein kinase)
MARQAKRRLLLAGGTEQGAAIRAFVRDAVADFGGSKRASEDLVQAVDEVTCNALLHGYNGKPGELELQAEIRDGRIEITVLDRAPVFDPTVPADEDARARARRPGTAGVGLHLARTMTDAVRHHVRPGGGNEVTLVRSIDDRTDDRKHDRTEPAEEG